MTVSPGPRGRACGVGLLLVVLTVAAYWEVAELPFVAYDDYVYVVDNTELRSGLDVDAIRRAFATTYGLRSNWVPLTALSFQLDYELYGLDATGYHTSADRSGSLLGSNAWNFKPPDGSVSVGDIGAVVAQFGHLGCSAS